MCTARKWIITTLYFIAFEIPKVSIDLFANYYNIKKIELSGLSIFKYFFINITSHKL